MQDFMNEGRARLRHEPIERRVRASSGGETIVDSTRALLLWEPRRICPSYAVPVEDISAELSPAPSVNGDAPEVLHPGIPFSVHSAAGSALNVGDREGAAFRFDDPDLDGYVVLDFAAFEWLDEEEPVISHPRDPRHRIDVCRSDRTVRIEHQGRLLAESNRARWLFEGTFPFVRYYLPRDDVAVPLVRDDSLVTACAYKGRATYWSVADEPALARIAWTYEQPLNDADQVRGLVSFFTERLDLSVDGDPVPRVWTPWSEPD